MIKKGDRIMVDSSEFGEDWGIVRRAVVAVNRHGVPSIKFNNHEIKVPLGSIRRVMSGTKCTETPFGLEYYKLYEMEN